MNQRTWPSYLSLGADEIRRRAAEAVAALGSCQVCPRNCKVNRLEGEARVCATGRYARVSTWFPHFGEEDCLRGSKGSGTIFFAFCNLKCVFCFHPDTLVSTTGGLTRIEDLFDNAVSRPLRNGAVAEPADTSVWTREVRATKLTKVFSRPFDGELLSIKPYSCPPITVTPDHRIFTSSRADLANARLVPAEDLERGQYLVVPKRVPGGEQVEFSTKDWIATEPSQPKRARARRISSVELVQALESDRTSLELGQELGYHPAYVRTLRTRLRRQALWTPEAPPELNEEDGRVRFVGEHRPGIPAKLPLDESLAWLLGLYCAEGHVRHDRNRPNSCRLIFTLGPHEHELVKQAAERLAKLFGVLPQIVNRRTTTAVECGKTSAARFFEALCGNGAHTKRVPPPLLRTTKQVIRAFLEGYLAGDGTRTAAHLVANTVSRSLAFGLFELGLHLGVLPAFHEWRGCTFS